MKVFCFLVGTLFLGLVLFPSLSGAQHAHGVETKNEPMKMKMDAREVLVEGMKITFTVMDTDEHKKMLQDMKMKEDIEPGTTHNITVTLKDENNQKEITDASLSMKVIDPNGKEQIKSLKYEDMMKSYDAYFNLTEKGKYQVLVLVKKQDMKRTAGIYYEIK